MDHSGSARAEIDTFPLEVNTSAPAGRRSGPPDPSGMVPRRQSRALVPTLSVNRSSRIGWSAIRAGQTVSEQVQRADPVRLKRKRRIHGTWPLGVAARQTNVHVAGGH